MNSSVRTPDKSYTDTLITEDNEINTEDDELRQVLEASLVTASQDYERQKKSNKYDSQISHLTQLAERRAREKAEKEEAERQKAKARAEELKLIAIDEREQLMQPVIRRLCSTRSRQLMDILNVYIQSGKHIDMIHYNDFKDNMRKEEFVLMSELFVDNSEIDENDYASEDDEYEYEE